MEWSTHDVAGLLRETTTGLRHALSTHVQHVAHVTAEVEEKVLRTSVRRPPKAVAPEELSAILARVRKCLQERRPDLVKPRELRLSLRAFTQLKPTEVRQLLDRFERGWRIFIDALFRERLSLTPQEQADWFSIAERAPASVRLLHGPLERSRLQERDAYKSALQVAQQFEATASLQELSRQIAGPGLLDQRWPYTAAVYGYWCRRKPANRSAVWAELKEDAALEAMLLPRKPRSQSSWFDSNRTLPMGIHEGRWATALAACGFLDATLQGGGNSSTFVDEVREVLLTAYRDPREFRAPKDHPESQGWQDIRHLDTGLYARFIEQLLQEDMSLFFEHVEIDTDRRRFWQRYLKQIHSTRFFFSAATSSALRFKFRSADKKFQQTLRRAQTLTGSQGVDAFCLIFPDLVVVEFSRTGNATYLYRRNDFDSTLNRSSLSMQELKNSSLSLGRLLHMSNWEDNFTAELARRGIYVK